MSIFSKLKDAILGRKDVPAAERPQIPAGMAGGPPLGTPQGGGTATAGTAGQSTAQPGQQVDVEQTLTQLAASKGNPDLNWRTSIVDLMKLVGIDSSLDNRKELATELGYTGDKDGSAEMNIWLHREVMRQLAANGGKVPAGMTD